MRLPRQASHDGITLIELMIVLVVIAIVAAIAWPSYRAHVVRSHRASAISALTRVQVAQEKFFLQNSRYSANLSGDAASGGLGLSPRSEDGSYELDLRVSANGFGYIARARPRPGGSQMDDRTCTEFTIDQNGTRAALSDTRDTTAECWR